MKHYSRSGHSIIADDVDDGYRSSCCFLSSHSRNRSSLTADSADSVVTARCFQTAPIHYSTAASLGSRHWRGFIVDRRLFHCLM